MKYPKQASLYKYYDADIDTIDRIHNAWKHGDYDSLKKYHIYLKPIRRRRNGHKRGVYQHG